MCGGSDRYLAGEERLIGVIRRRGSEGLVMCVGVGKARRVDASGGGGGDGSVGRVCCLLSRVVSCEGFSK